MRKQTRSRLICRSEFLVSTRRLKRGHIVLMPIETFINNQDIQGTFLKVGPSVDRFPSVRCSRLFFKDLVRIHLFKNISNNTASKKQSVCFACKILALIRSHWLTLHLLHGICTTSVKPAYHCGAKSENQIYILIFEGQAEHP